VWRMFRKKVMRGVGEAGAATVEFALCLIPLLLIVAGIVDYGESWYMQSVIATGSREGARYATRYTTDSSTGQRTIPSSLNPNIHDYVLTSAGYNLTTLLPSNATPDVPTPTGTGYTTGTAGLPVTVTVTAQKYWLFLNRIMPGLSNPQVLSSTTTMACE
jgi:Flp pilus assembly protein TadG